MQQRYWPSLGRVEEHVVKIADDDYMATVDPESLLPIYAATRGIGRNWRPSENLARVIPYVVFFCIFVLWWFSFTVKVVRVDGRIAAIREIDIPLLLNNTQIGIALLAAEAMSPLPLVPQNFTVTNVTEFPQVNKAPQNFTVNYATEAQLVSTVLQNLTVSNVTEAQLVSNQTQSVAVKNVTEAQLVSKRSRNLPAKNVTKVLVSKKTKILRANKVTEAQLVSKQKKILRANKVTAAQLMSRQTKSLTANNVTGVEAMSSLSLASQNLAIKNVPEVHR